MPVTTRGSWVGANFWSRTGGPRMWVRYDPEVVRDELAVLAEHGCNVTRSFCYWPELVPEPERLDEAVVERFRDFLDAHAELGLGTIPTFIVGHMSGENWDPRGAAGATCTGTCGSCRSRPGSPSRSPAASAGHEAVVGWLISNEMPLYGGEASAEDITSWARIMVQAVRAGGGSQPVSLGDGAWGVEVIRAVTTATRCAPWLLSSTSSGRMSTRCRTTRCASRWPRPSPASSAVVRPPGGPRGIRASPPTSSPTRTALTTTGRCCTPA